MLLALTYDGNAKSYATNDVVEIGTYKITFNQDLLDELNSKTNYEFVIVDGNLTIL